MVMRRVRGFTLVGIVEFIMYGCIRYFRERYASAAVFHGPTGSWTSSVVGGLLSRWARSIYPVGRIASCFFLEDKTAKKERQRRKRGSRTSAGTADGETWQGKPADSRGLPSSAAGPTARSPAPYTSSRTPPPGTPR